LGVLDSSEGVSDRGGCAFGDGEVFVIDLDKSAELFFGGDPYSLYKSVIGYCG
jgi:hypothetical protein